MTHVLLISQEKNVFEELEKAFSDNNIMTEWTNSAQNAISRVSDEKIDLLIMEEKLPDMAARALIEQVLFKNAMMNCVVLSALSHKDFHEAYEGLGVLMQFPMVPGKEHARNLLDHMEHIARISSRPSELKGASPQ